MGDLNLTQDRPRVNVKFTSDDGVEHDHQFEVMPLTKARFEAAVKYQRRAAQLDQNEDMEELAQMMPEFCDEMLRSTNGPVTITSLWQDAGLPFAWVMRIAQYVQQEAIGSPPA